MRTPFRSLAAAAAAAAALTLAAPAASALSPGDGFNNYGEAWTSCTIGAVGTYSGPDGTYPAAITAGHCAALGDRITGMDGQHIGHVTHSVDEGGGAYLSPRRDFAVIRLAPGVQGHSAQHRTGGGIGLATKDGRITGQTPVLIFADDGTQVYGLTPALHVGDSGANLYGAGGEHIGTASNYIVPGWNDHLVAYQRTDSGALHTGGWFTPGNVTGY